MRIALDAGAAPATVSNFLAYVDSGFYDGLIFHRVIPGFMAQGGGFSPRFEQRAARDPIALEATGLKNERGTIAMARTSSPDSATSQFFVNLEDNAFLDPTAPRNGYAAFGRLVGDASLATLDAIGAVETSPRVGFDDAPVDAVEIVSAARARPAPSPTVAPMSGAASPTADATPPPSRGAPSPTAAQTTRSPARSPAASIAAADDDDDSGGLLAGYAGPNTLYVAVGLLAGLSSMCVCYCAYYMYAREKAHDDARRKRWEDLEKEMSAEMAAVGQSDDAWRANVADDAEGCLPNRPPPRVEIRETTETALPYDAPWPKPRRRPTEHPAAAARRQRAPPPLAAGYRPPPVDEPAWDLADPGDIGLEGGQVAEADDADGGGEWM